MSKIKIGILAVQGDVTENFLATMASMSELGIDGSVIQVKTVEQISTLDGLIIPGGESTVIGQMSLVNGAIKKIKEKIESGMPVFGICAGMVFLSKNSQDRIVGNVDQPLLDIDFSKVKSGKNLAPIRKNVMFMWRNRDKVRTLLKSSNIRYDWIISTRLDIFYKNKLDYSDLDASAVNIPKGSDFGGYQDKIAIAKEPLMLSYLDVYDNISNKVFLFNFLNCFLSVFILELISSTK